MSEEIIHTDPTQKVERGALTDTVLTVTAFGGTVQAVKTGVEAGAHLYDLLHPPKPDVPKLIVPSGTSKD